MRSVLAIILSVLIHGIAWANELPVLKIYHDADWANNIESSEAIWRGMHVALNEVDYTINGFRIELIKKNHSGNVIRSLGNLKSFINDDQAIVVVSGMHSPPLITNRTFINENKIPVLVPWAAGGPITRYPSSENSIFRLSVDDTKAGAAMVDFATAKYKCSQPYLLLESTPWGDSNAKSIRVALAKRGSNIVGIKRFSWGLQRHAARKIVQEVKDDGAKCLIMVSAAAEGAQIAKAMVGLDADERIPIISHWGITGGNFHRIIDAQAREALDLSFIQTCFSFMHEPMSPLAQAVFSDLKEMYPADIRRPKDIKAPVGLINAYDLTRLFIAALENVAMSDDILANRVALKKALENLNDPIVGLTKTYSKPFRQYSDADDDAHEALGRENICMAYYGLEDEIIVHKNSAGK